MSTLLPETAAGLPIIKAHAYGNDFLYAPMALVEGRDLAAIARAVCDRYTGIGADGLILYRPTQAGATMRLLNADGSPSEVSGNGVRGLAAIVIQARRRVRDAAAAGLDASAPPQEPGECDAGSEVIIETDAGAKRLRLLDVTQGRLTFEAAMGTPADVRQLQLSVAGESLTVTALSIGNPQCVHLGALPDRERFLRLGAALTGHEAFPHGTNVEFAEIESPGRVRILIWERGVGPTLASGTGACAAAIAAAAHGGAARAIDVVAPGGTQRVEWTDAGVLLTGWAETVFEGTWLGAGNF